MTILESANCKKPILLRNIELYHGILDGYYLKGNSNEDFIKEINKLKNDETYYSKASHMANKCAKYYSEENVSKMWRSYYNKISNLDHVLKTRKNENKITFKKSKKTEK